MNREIRFRAWDKKRNVMIGDDYPKNWGDNTDEWYFDLACMQLTGIEEISNDEYHIVMQYTGLKDKNGVEIYEGDIVRYIKEFDIDKNINVAIVEYVSDKFRCGFILKPIIETQINFGSDDENCECIVSFSFYDEMGQNFVWDKLEVIGNIYENPELLN